MLGFLLFAFVVIVAGGTIAYVWYRLERSSIEIPPQAEKTLGSREALRFALDNRLPITSGPPENRL